MALQYSTLRPGLLVVLHTYIQGNVSYSKQIIEADHIVNGKRIARWETERKIADAKEHELAEKTRSKAGSLIRGVCKHSAFGLLCPEADGDKLEAAIAAARELANAFNAKARLSRVTINVLMGHIAPDDVEAVKSINAEVRKLLQQMQDGVREMNPAVIRDAANKARTIGGMLNEESQVRIQIAIDTARKVAKEITKAGESAAQEVDKAAIRKIREARTAFLDLDDEAAEVRKPTVAGRAVDLSPSVANARAAVRGNTVLDME